MIRTDCDGSKFISRKNYVNRWCKTRTAVSGSQLIVAQARVLLDTELPNKFSSV